MKSFMTFIEIFISIHLLLSLGSFFISVPFFSKHPSFKLRLIRLIFISCVFSPVVVYVLSPPQKTLVNPILPLEKLQKPSHKSVLNPEFGYENETIISALKKSNEQLNFNFLFILIVTFLTLGALYRSFFLIKDMRKLRSVLGSALLYRRYGKIEIKVTDQCVVPFSVQLFQTAYIILPVSILHSSTNTKLAIAHEGQHHRQGDCLWAYFMEGIRIVFWGNPCLARWQRISNELQELACDESLVGHQTISAHDYGHCLFHVAQTASQSHISCQKFACTAQMAWGCEKETESFITRRIYMLSKYQRIGFNRKVFGSVFAISAIFSSLGTAYAAQKLFPEPNISNEIDTSSLDPRIQKIADEEISAAVTRTRAKSGVIAVADAHTGKIVAFAQSGYVTGVNNWKDRIFSPASTIKPFVAAAAIDAGVSSASQVYDCHEPYNVDGTEFTNGYPNIQNLSVSDAMIKSVNICLIKVAEDLGSEKFRRTLSHFGFDMNTPWENDKSDALNLAHATLGSSIPVNMGTLTKAFTILANKGHLFPENSGEAVSERTSNTVTHMLEEVVKQGTGKRAAIAHVSVAGKTGTLSNEYSSSSLALFAGYVPADNPRFVSIVIMEDAYLGSSREQASGGAVAAPVFRNVMEKSLETLTK